MVPKQRTVIFTTDSLKKAHERIEEERCKQRGDGFKLVSTPYLVPYILAGVMGQQGWYAVSLLFEKVPD